MSQSALELGKAFLTENAQKPGIITTASGLQYEILREGNGPCPKLKDTVVVNYRGAGIDIGPNETLIFEVELLKVWED
jgi:FKBP-type peptidyl-prolyl cis-trans isomerase